MRQIVKLLPRERQTMLFSATQTTKVRPGAGGGARAGGRGRRKGAGREVRRVVGRRAARAPHARTFPEDARSMRRRATPGLGPAKLGSFGSPHSIHRPPSHRPPTPSPPPKPTTPQPPPPRPPPPKKGGGPRAAVVQAPPPLRRRRRLPGRVHARGPGAGLLRRARGQAAHAAVHLPKEERGEEGGGRLGGWGLGGFGGWGWVGVGVGGLGSWGAEGKACREDRARRQAPASTPHLA